MNYMDKAIHINHKDFPDLITKKCGFSEEKAGREYHYSVTDKYGEGRFNRIMLGNGIEVNMVDVIFHNNLRLHYKLKQPLFEVVYMISGDLMFFNNEMNSIMKMRNGEANITFSNYVEGWLEYLSNKHYRYISICTSQPLSKVLCADEDWDDEIGDFINIDNKLSNHLMIPQKINPILQVPFIQMKENSMSSLLRLVYLESKAMEIVALTLENEIIKHKDTTCKIKLNKSDLSKMYLVKKIMIENMENPPSILELSKMVGLNTYKLKVGFKEIFGTTVFGYLRDIRMEKARLLLENHELNINEIANEVGYSNPSHFATAFRKKYGVTPGHFRF